MTDRSAAYCRAMERLVAVVQELSMARDLPAVMAVVRQAARELTGADGATFVLKDKDQCYYAEENAIAPLWKGCRFPVTACISGWAMLNREAAVIEDIYADPRIPVDAYRPTFVQSLAMVPIRTAAPIGAIGNYWAERHQATAEEVKLLQTLADTTAVALENVQLYTDLVQAYDTTLEGWSRALDMRDRETERHTLRVTEMAVALGRQMGMSEAALVHLRRGALLHDIGKMGVPDHILLKPGLLTEAETQIMQRHPRAAYELLAPIGFLGPALDIPYCHHEKWDGSGYPRGLKGEEIPLAARVFAIVDVWDALRSDRPYRAAWSEERAREYLYSLSGSHFDPQVVAAFLDTGFAPLWDARLCRPPAGQQTPVWDLQLPVPATVSAVMPAAN